MERRQFLLMIFGVIGVFGIQIGFYELVKGKAPLLVVYGLLALGFACAFMGFGAYRQMEDEQNE